MKAFGRWFAIERARRNFFSQVDLANAAKVGRSTIFEIESGKGFSQRHPRVKDKIAAALKMDVFELELIERELKGTGNKVPRVVVLSNNAYQVLSVQAKKLGHTSVEDWLETMASQLGRGIRTTQQIQPAVSEIARSEVHAHAQPKGHPEV